MYKRILVAVDGSLTSNLALDEAIKIAKESGGELHLVHVLNTITLNTEGDFYSLPEWLNAIRRSAESVLHNATDRAKQAGVSCQGKLLEIDTIGYRIPEMIAEEAKTWSADVIVIGTHGRHGMHRLLMGSVAEGVVRTAAVPVLLIRGNNAGA
ncbi:hypothetical protein SKTS_10160 [Sulfurimicrobium lacus]|uniref:Universal stress protein n=1 Tax=Sulfurimicrobium lacus TaxID=2715678 RepID=A0A6F8V9X9_9PROT|nr:universal stress protein [Sulfurimicrobium lacus]BCB26130.1 hypothetical protein SKTS_10160 [Sulfurimicrobium lacus]